VNREDLAAVLQKHAAWLQSEEGGERANLRGADLQEADLRANLSGATLWEADLSGANLSEANLSGANLREANLRGADLRDANLREANLRGADLREADLSGADLREADLSGANLRGATLCEADLSGADLDFSCWPLWCGSRGVRVDARIFRQLAMHLCGVEVEDDECRAAQSALMPLAQKCHRANEFFVENAK